jgi:hypothetical protein
MSIKLPERISHATIHGDPPQAVPDGDANGDVVNVPEPKDTPSTEPQVSITDPGSQAG